MGARTLLARPWTDHTPSTGHDARPQGRAATPARAGRRSRIATNGRARTLVGSSGFSTCSRKGQVTAIERGRSHRRRTPGGLGGRDNAAGTFLVASPKAFTSGGRRHPRRLRTSHAVGALPQFNNRAGFAAGRIARQQSPGLPVVARLGPQSRGTFHRYLRPRICWTRAGSTRLADVRSTWDRSAAYGICDHVLMPGRVHPGHGPLRPNAQFPADYARTAEVNGQDQAVVASIRGRTRGDPDGQRCPGRSQTSPTEIVGRHRKCPRASWAAGQPSLTAPHIRRRDINGANPEGSSRLAPLATRRTWGLLNRDLLYGGGNA